MNTMFTEGFLANYVSDFSLSSIADVRGKLLTINSLISEMKSGKFSRLKEEEVKSRFINAFFGDVLGFNYGNPGKFLLREEKKTVFDATKPDAALGFFSLENMVGDVRAVIEMKGFDAGLDTIQKRKSGNKTPVEQAFEYAPKMGGNCKWVIVSNMREIRFYPAMDRGRCQVFPLENLAKEEDIKTLLYLFHKDRFIKEVGQSTTDILYERVKNAVQQPQPPVHILDRLHHTLKGFDGLNYVDPNYLANIKPFNVLDDYVWHYKKHTLVTLNAELFHLLTGVKVAEREIVITDDLRAELTESSVVEPEEKLRYCFLFMTNCGIHRMRAIQDYQSIEDKNKRTIGFSIRHYMGSDDREGSVTLDINMRDTGVVCDCVKCNYRNFEHVKLITKLKAATGDDDHDTLEYAFGNYLVATDNFKAAYLIYKRMEGKLKGKEGKAVEYFLVKKNIKNLAKDILYYHSENDTPTRNDVKTIDLDKVVYDEVEFEVSRSVKDYLIQVKEDTLIYDVQDQIDDCFHEIERLKRFHDGQEKRPTMFNGVPELAEGYSRLYHHIHSNYIAYTTYRRYKYLCEKVFHGLVLSLSTPGEGIKELDEFYLTEAVLNIPTPGLKAILERVDFIQTSRDSQTTMVSRLLNFLNSYYKEGIFDHLDHRPETTGQLSNYAFEERHKQFFANFFSILSRMELLGDDIALIQRPLRQYLSVQDYLSYPDLDELGRFLTKKGNLFPPEELVELLKVFIDKDTYSKNIYHKIIPVVSLAIGRFYPQYRIENQHLIETALLKCRSSDGKRFDYGRLLNLVTICDEACRKILFTSFEKYLDKEFNYTFYEQLLKRTGYPVGKKGYFKKYVLCINDFKDKNTYRVGPNKRTDVIFNAFIFLLYDRQISRKRKEFDLLVNINAFEKWLFNPHQFDYTNFDVSWLYEIKGSDLLLSLRGISAVRRAVKKELDRKFDIRLAEINSILTGEGNRS